MIDWSRPFSAASHPARVYLLLKGVYLLFAFDVWLTMLSHGARYGMGDFNVTHFGWLDRILPVPSAAFYTGLMALIGLLALLHALTAGARYLRFLVALLFTVSWVISLFDSYQHHYLLSWILLWTIFVPDVSLESAVRRRVQAVRGVGMSMTAITCAIVYTFTAISKSEADWRAGHVLMRLSKSKVSGHPDPGALDPLRDALVSLLGVSEPVAWAMIAHSVIALQIVAAVGYLCAAERDARPSRLRSLGCLLGGLAAGSFHAFAEIGGMFDIGWFSYYMLWIAFVLLSPASWLSQLTHWLSWPYRMLSSKTAVAAPSVAPSTVLFQLLAAAVALSLVATRIDLPGALAAGLLAAVLLALWGALALRFGFMASAQRIAMAGALCAVAWGAAMMLSDVRFDYYRRGAGELRAMGKREEALVMYRQADRYAPAGQSRKKQIRALEEMIRATSRDSD